MGARLTGERGMGLGGGGGVGVGLKEGGGGGGGANWDKTEQTLGSCPSHESVEYGTFIRYVLQRNACALPMLLFNRWPLISVRLFAGCTVRVTWIALGGAVFFGLYEKTKILLLSSSVSAYDSWRSLVALQGRERYAWLLGRFPEWDGWGWGRRGGEGEGRGGGEGYSRRCSGSRVTCRLRQEDVFPSLPEFRKYTHPTFPKEKCMIDVVRIGSIIIFHLSDLWNANSSYCVM